MHEMQAIVTDDPGGSLSVYLSVTPFYCAGSFGAAFAELLWPFVIIMGILSCISDWL